ncbi:MAG: uridine kinase [Bacteroidia bacterium]
MYIVGICGGSASGKTYLLRQLLKHFDRNQMSLISLDNYYKDWEEQTPDEEGHVNFDHPDSLDLERFEQDVRRLMNGETIEIKEYTFNNPKKTARTFRYEPTPLIILEGILVFHHKPVADLMDLRIFIDAEDYLRLSRRLLRDVRERNYSFEETIRDYHKFVAPMYRQFVEPTKNDCHIIIPNHKNTHDNMKAAVEMVVNHLVVKVGEEQT